MKPIKVMIAEDERLAREELTYLLQQEEGLELLPSAGNGRELLELAKTWEPDVVFLDVQMPEMEGVQAARMLRASPHPPRIVFTTAHEEYAVEAFGLNAVDYLLKPYSHMRLKETLQRIRGGAHPEPEEPAEAGKSQAHPSAKWNKLLIDDGKKHIFVDPRTILYAEKEEKLTRLHTQGQSFDTRYTLQELQDRLTSYAFFRAHRSFLVNLEWMEELTPWFNGTYNLVLKDAKRTTIPVSREAAKELFRLLES